MVERRGGGGGRSREGGEEKGVERSVIERGKET